MAMILGTLALAWGGLYFRSFEAHINSKHVSVSSFLRFNYDLEWKDILTIEYQEDETVTHIYFIDTSGKRNRLMVTELADEDRIELVDFVEGQLKANKSVQTTP